MRKTLFSVSAALFAAGFTAQAGAVAQSPAAIDGSLYAVVEAAYDGSVTSAASYLQFFDGAVTTTAFTVTIVGAQSGLAYGQPVSLKIPSNASIQYSLAQLLTLAGSKSGAGAANGDTSFTVYIQNPDATAGFQHLTWNGTSQFFENASVCNNGLLAAATLAGGNSIVVPNARTSSLGASAFTSQLAFHNYASSATTYLVTLVDAGVLESDGSTISATAGNSVGQTNFVIPANTTVYKQFTDLQTLVKWQPGATQYNANVIVSDPSGAAPALVVGHPVHSPLGGDINMTTACAVNNPASPTKYAGTIAGIAMQSGTLLITVQPNSAGSSGVSKQSSVERVQASVEKPQATTQTSSATLLLGGTSVTLSGTFDPTSDTVNLSGSGYTFTGTATNGIYSGTYTGPNGGNGNFSTLSTSQGAVTAYCGSYSENNGSGTGIINLQIAANGVASGDTSPVSGGTEPGTFTGQATGSTVNIVHHSADGNPLNDTHVTTTIVNGSFSGSFTTGQGGLGTFSGSKCALPSS